MRKQELLELINKLPDDYEIYTRYGGKNQVSDVEFEFVADDEGIGEFYLVCSNGKNIQTGTFDGDDEGNEHYIQRLKEEMQNAFEDLDKEDLDALYGTLLEINENIVPHIG